MINFLAIVGGLSLGYLLITVLGVQPWIIFVLTTCVMVLWVPVNRMLGAGLIEPPEEDTTEAPPSWLETVQAKKQEREEAEAERARQQLVFDAARDVFDDHAEPALFLIREDQETSQSKSRIGGKPTLPPEIEWPMDYETPMHFLAELHLDEMPRLVELDVLPQTGVFYFFMYLGEYSEMQTGRVIYAPMPGQPRSAPPETEPFDCSAFFEYEDVHIPGHAVRAVELPVLDRNSVDSEACEQDVWLALHDVQLAVYHEELARKAKALPGKLHGARHYIYSMVGGPKLDIPNPTSGSGIKLLQLDSDNDLGLQFGDMGVVEFWIEEDDLRAGRLDRALVESSSC